MTTYFVGFRKWIIRIEVAVPSTLAANKREARTIAARELRGKGYRFEGVN